MNNAPALSALARLKDNPALTDWLDNHFHGRPVLYRYGLMAKPTAQQYPFIAIAPGAGDGGPQMTGRSQHLSIQVGVQHNDILEHDGLSVCQGQVLVGELLELVKEALYTQPINALFFATWDYSYHEESDAGLGHPYYQGALEIPITLHFDQLVE